MEKLKPCPFCGAEMRLFQNPAFRDLWQITSDEHKQMCHLEGNQGPGYARKRDAVAAWNRRASDLAMEKAREAAREALEEARGGLMNKYVADKIAAAIAALKEVA